LQDIEKLNRLRQAASVERAYVNFNDVPTFEANEPAQDVQWLKQRLLQAGFAQICVVDLTKPEFNVPVVRVLIPGLETSREVPGFTPGQRASKVLQQRALEKGNTH
jgi:ribosomal protein S12 methylthiotransferase accessory factor